MSSNLARVGSGSLSGMRRVLSEAAQRLSIDEGSIAHEQLAIRVLRLFESTQDEEEVLAAALNDDRVGPLEPDDEVALAQLGAAAILLWQEIGAKARQDLLRTAVTVGGMTRAADAGERLRRLISLQHP
jgi:hypothetical protein